VTAIAKQGISKVLKHSRMYSDHELLNSTSDQEVHIGSSTSIQQLEIFAEESCHCEKYCFLHSVVRRPRQVMPVVRQAGNPA
jgi:hypothetical protein